MRPLLIESKRDNYLLPYLEIFKEKGINISLGELKKKLLNIFHQFAGLTNLSLGSNFYLAGAARYYFNGDLTANKELGIFTDTPDSFNTEICERLNVLILILRNAIIDSVGETFEQPEDFGTLSLAKLLKKYNSKINKALTISNQSPTFNTSGDIGKGTYSYEIIFSQEECRKYEKYTSPGAWCITWSNTNYNMYIKDLNIHYVIFKQKGFENVPRKEEREMWKEGTYSPKPQDTYGNSLIALLQSNENGEPVYITSRWNHGYETNVEADHAYTKEEFMQITGTSDADLQHIFETWKNFKNSESSRKKNERKENMLSMLRTLKYAQMRLNGGENLFSVFNISDEDNTDDGNEASVLVGNGSPNKSIMNILFYVNNIGYQVLVDRNTILFDTSVPISDCPKPFEYSEKSDRYSAWSKLNNIIAVHVSQKIALLYNVRLHQFINLNGNIKLKYLDKYFYQPFYGLRYVDKGEHFYYELRGENKMLALFDSITNMPLRTPDGDMWFVSIKDSSREGNDYRDCSQLYAFKTRENILSLLTYGSNNSYIFFPKDKKFLKINLDQGWKKNIIRCLVNEKEKIYAIDQTDSYTDSIHIFKEDKQLSIENIYNFRYVSRFSTPKNENDFIRFQPAYGDGDRFTYDEKTNSVILLNGKYLNFDSLTFIGEEKDATTAQYYSPSLTDEEFEGKYLSFEQYHDGGGVSSYILRLKDRAFLINPITKTLLWDEKRNFSIDVKGPYWSYNSNHIIRIGVSHIMNEKPDYADKNLDGVEIIERKSRYGIEGQVEYITTVDLDKISDAVYLERPAKIKYVDEQENNNNIGIPSNSAINEVTELEINDIFTMVKESITKLLK